MTITEASEKYQIPLDILREFEMLETHGRHQVDFASRECGSHDLERLNLLVLLHESGFTPEETRLYWTTPPKAGASLGKWTQILNQKRAKMLDEIHAKEKQLENMDYLRYELQKKGMPE